jgi:hypothetical protein
MSVLNGRHGREPENRSNGPLFQGNLNTNMMTFKEFLETTETGGYTSMYLWSDNPEGQITFQVSDKPDAALHHEGDTVHLHTVRQHGGRHAVDHYRQPG